MIPWENDKPVSLRNNKLFLSQTVHEKPRAAVRRS